MAPNDKPLAATESPHAERLIAIVAAMLGELRPNAPARRITLDAEIERDLGLDSLSRVELATRVEQAFAVRLPDRLATSARTLRQLLDAIAKAKPREAPSSPPARASLPAAVRGMPVDARTIVDAFLWHVERHPEREHVTLLEGDDVQASLSYARLWSEANEVAAGLADAGVARGDTVALMLPTSAAFFQAFLGAMLLGAIPVPLYPPVRWSEIEEHVRGRAAILANSVARVLVTVPEAMFLGRLVRAELPHLRAVTSVERLRHARKRSAPRSRAAGGDIAMLQYTSGSTGDPKGVILTHDNLLANIRVIGHAAAATSTDRFVSWLPLYHDMGLIGAWLATMFHAVPLVVMPPTSFLAHPSRWLWAIHRHRATISAGPNFAYEMAASRIPDEELAGLDLGSWRLAFNGAEPVRAATLERFATRFAPYRFDRRALTPVYGLAEAAVGLAFPPLGRGPRIDRIDPTALARDGVAVFVREGTAEALEVVSNGSPLPGHEVRVVDEGGRELPARTEGHLEFRGPSATSGYYRNPEATARLFRGAWLDTGDVGYIADGELFLTSRAKDLIKRGGHNLHPYDLEAAVGDLPGIRKGCVAVFGTPDHASGTERVIVVAETRSSDAAARAGLRERIAALAAIHLDGPPDEVLLVPPHTVLKTSSGKIRRAACRDLYRRGMLEARRPAVWRQLGHLATKALYARMRRSVSRVAEIAYGLYAWLVFAAVALAGAIPFAIRADPQSRYRLVHALAAAVVRLLRIPLTVTGDLTSASGKTIAVVNHASYVDAIIVVAALSSHVHFTAKREFADAPMMGYLLHGIGTHFVERSDATRSVEDTRELAAALRRGETLVVFPEGTFTRAPGLAPFRLGAFALSAEEQAPVVPIVLRGTRSVLRDLRWLPVRHPIEVRVLPPMLADGRDWSAAVRLRDRVRQAMLAACGEPDLAA
ncbi:MAG: AMP-binding protein [Rudaea sp.]